MPICTVLPEHGGQSRNAEELTKIMGPMWGRTVRHLTAAPDPPSWERRL